MFFLKHPKYNSVWVILRPTLDVPIITSCFGYIELAADSLRWSRNIQDQMREVIPLARGLSLHGDLDGRAGPRDRTYLARVTEKNPPYLVSSTFHERTVLAIRRSVVERWFDFWRVYPSAIDFIVKRFKNTPSFTDAYTDNFLRINKRFALLMLRVLRETPNSTDGWTSYSNGWAWWEKLCNNPQFKDIFKNFLLTGEETSTFYVKEKAFTQMLAEEKGVSPEKIKRLMSFTPTKEKEPGKYKNVYVPPTPNGAVTLTMDGRIHLRRRDTPLPPQNTPLRIPVFDDFAHLEERIFPAAFTTTEFNTDIPPDRVNVRHRRVPIIPDVQRPPE
jgi:hypothetical protein